MSTEWTANQIRFQEWLSLPKYERIPPNQELLAPILGVREETLSRWKQKPGWNEAVNALARERLGQHLPEIYGALVREAEKGSIQHIRTALELAGELAQPGSEESPFAMRIEYVNDWRGNAEMDDTPSGSA